MTKTTRTVLDELRQMGCGWDGNPLTEPPSSLAIDRAEEILSSEPEVIPNRYLSGGLIIRWRDKRGNVIGELSYGPDGEECLE